MPNPSFKIFGDLDGADILLTAEHASNALPDGFSWASEEAFLQNTHWAIDIGIQELIELLIPEISCAAVTATYSRLYCDLNRDPARSDLIRTEAQGVEISFNQNVSEEECKNRLEHCHQSYHGAIDRYLNNRRKTQMPKILISLHSFTPIWDHKLRTMDVGVLFCEPSPLVDLFAQAWSNQGYFVELNEPYSGYSGLIYSAHRHGTHHKIPYIELEFNQTILSSPKRIAQVAKDMIAVLDLIYDSI
ncbi:MAG: hypothetical protein CMK59_02320 [Proteobacteria bacterium]|nr:hypothetical protein [Pseudomonadota bacterium]